MLRHYRFMVSKTRYSFYVPIRDAVPGDEEGDVLSQVLKYLKDHDIDKHDVVITQTSTAKLNMPLISWVMSKEYEKEVRRC